MPARKVGLPNDVPKDLADGLAAIRASMDVREDFEAPVLRPPPSRPPPGRSFLILIAPTSS